MAATPYIVMNRKARSQPQGAFTIDWSNRLTRGLRALFRGDLRVELVNRQLTSLAGANPPGINDGINGRQFDASAGSTICYIPESALGKLLYEPIAPPLTLFGLFNAQSNGTTHYMFGREFGASANASWMLGAFNGSFQGPILTATTSGGSVTINAVAADEDMTAGFHPIVGVIGVTQMDLWTQRFHYSGSTPSGNFSYSSGVASYLSTLAIGGTYNGGAGGHQTALGGLSDQAWDKADAFAFFDNPWQMFRQQRRIYSFDAAGGAIVVLPNDPLMFGSAM